MTDQWQTMSITSPGPSTLPKGGNRVYQVKSTNEIGDIDGARSAVRYKVYHDKPEFLNTSDIDGAQSKQLIRGRNTRDNSLYIDDIDGTRRAIKDRMMRTNRHVDPLCPNYPVPSYVAMEPVQTMFIKDQLQINDIEGTHPKPKITYSTRDIMRLEDIDGTRPGLKTNVRLNQCPTKEIMEVGDITAKNRYIDKTHRVTDPNNPQYNVNGMEIKDDKYTKPRLPRNYVPGFNLETKDIKGADAGSRYASPFTRREYRNTNFIGDIEGSRADTIRPGITTLRETHPLQPVYQSLDPGELLLPVIAPLIPAEMVKIPTLPSVHSGATLAHTSSRPKTEPMGESTRLTPSWGATGDFDATNFSFTGGLETVQFQTLSKNQEPTGKPPRPATLALPLTDNFSGNNTGGYNSNRQPTTQRTMNVQNAANNIINFGVSSARSGGKSVGASPVVTGRVTPTMAQKKASLDRQSEINMVRQLM